jgi:hypothetical protein
MTGKQDVAVAKTLAPERFAHGQKFIAGRPLVFREAEEQADLSRRIGGARGRNVRGSFDRITDDGLALGIFELGFLRGMNGYSCQQQNQELHAGILISFMPFSQTILRKASGAAS